MACFDVCHVRGILRVCFILLLADDFHRARWLVHVKGSANAGEWGHLSPRLWFFGCLPESVLALQNRIKRETKPDEGHERNRHGEPPELF